MRHAAQTTPAPRGARADGRDPPTTRRSTGAPDRAPMQLHTLDVVKTARYGVLAGPGPVCEVWVACHGYGQLAAYFGRHFRGVVRPGRLVVVPEAASRFYIDGAGGGGTYRRVGASWMTREIREADIGDIQRQLDDTLVAACAAHGADPAAVRLVGFGFSQGTATVTRWLAHSPLVAARARRADALVLWGGALPHDLDLAAHRGWLADARPLLVAGDADGYATPARVMEQEARLRDAGIPHATRGFAGGHKIQDRLLAEIGDAVWPADA